MSGSKEDGCDCLEGPECSSANCKDGFCVAAPRAGEGEGCSDAFPCDDNSYCAEDDEASVCVLRAGFGEVCTTNGSGFQGSCATDLECEDSECRWRALLEGEACVAEADLACEDGLDCIASVCAEPVALASGDACEPWDDRCDAGLFCDEATSLCEQQKSPDGGACTLDADCEEGLLCGAFNQFGAGTCSEPVSCEEDAQCTGEQLCLAGECRLPPPDYLAECDPENISCSEPLECFEDLAGETEFAFFCDLPEEEDEGDEAPEGCSINEDCAVFAEDFGDAELVCLDHDADNGTPNECRPELFGVACESDEACGEFLDCVAGDPVATCGDPEGDELAANGAACTDGPDCASGFCNFETSECEEPPELEE